MLASRNKSFALGFFAVRHQYVQVSGDTAVRGSHSVVFSTFCSRRTGGDAIPGRVDRKRNWVAAIGLSLGFSLSADGKTAYAFFDDGGSAPGLEGDVDLDYDDLAFSISAVPVPAGGLLLISGLGALAAARRRKQA